MTQYDKGQDEQFPSSSTANRIALALMSFLLGGWIAFLAVLAMRK
jgi:hypothetical protein